jgi:hypothetical protein
MILKRDRGCGRRSRGRERDAIEFGRQRLRGQGGGQRGRDAIEFGRPASVAMRADGAPSEAKVSVHSAPPFLWNPRIRRRDSGRLRQCSFALVCAYRAEPRQRKHRAEDPAARLLAHVQHGGRTPGPCTAPGRAASVAMRADGTPSEAKVSGACAAWPDPCRRPGRRGSGPRSLAALRRSTFPRGVPNVPPLAGLPL